MEAWEVCGKVLEFDEEDHIYVYDGVILPSITQAMKVKFGRKYEGVDQNTLKKAADAGTAMHEAIQKFCETGEETDLQEVRNFRFLQKKYGFNVLKNEVPVILFKDDDPILAGRLDMVIEFEGSIGLADLKRTSTLDKEYLAYQLNLYRIAYQQCYGEKVEFLKGIHLREDVRKYVNIPVKEQKAWELVEEYERSRNGDL